MDISFSSTDPRMNHFWQKETSTNTSYIWRPNSPLSLGMVTTGALILALVSQSVTFAQEAEPRSTTHIAPIGPSAPESSNQSSLGDEAGQELSHSGA